MKKIAIVYWSGTGNTEAMAKEIFEACKDKSDPQLIFSDNFKKEMIDDFDRIAFGCPAMGDEQLEEISFEPMFESCEEKLKGKEIALFGSYSWNDGQWMRDWEERVNKDQALLIYEPVIAYDYPDENVLSLCKNLAEALCR
ncbi:flavodoxin domain-containing protein [Peptoniphilus catoniae]|uniref:flavodoxin domain-containing protein n=1 Tax=Peptoniphilus catoniae TaxID=1660341 RepID=UPI0010FF399F|nr:flavodoxin domain-containing protein [Peptoniphilus catoniae]